MHFLCEGRKSNVVLVGNPAQLAANNMLDTPVEPAMLSPRFARIDGPNAKLNCVCGRGERIRPASVLIWVGRSEMRMLRPPQATAQK